MPPPCGVETIGRSSVPTIRSRVGSIDCVAALLSQPGPNLNALFSLASIAAVEQQTPTTDVIALTKDEAMSIRKYREITTFLLLCHDAEVHATDPDHQYVR